MPPDPRHDPALDAHLPEVQAFNAKIPREDPRLKWTPAAIERARDLSQVMGGIFKPSTLPGFAEAQHPRPATSRKQSPRSSRWRLKRRPPGEFPVWDAAPRQQGS